MQTITKVKATVTMNEYGQAVLVVGRCPFCGERHEHTCDDAVPVYGFRSAHCSGVRTELREYELVR